MAIISDCICYDLIAVVVTLLVVAITFLKWKLQYWERLGVPTLNPTVPFGNGKDLFFGRLAFGELFLDFYKKLKAQGHKHGGVYLGPTPVYVAVDPEVVKNIMQVDFEHFAAHGGYVNEEADPLTLHLFNIDGPKWRNLRVKMTPTFTSGKMKMMFHTMADCSVGLTHLLDEASDNSAIVDIRDILSRFGTDVIASVAFGLNVNSLKNPDDEFRQFGKKVVEIDFWMSIKIFMQVILPYGFLKAIKHRFTRADVEQFFMKVIKDTVTYRETNNVYRKDFMHLLLQLKNRGTVEDDEKIKGDDGKTGEIGLTMNDLAAQAFVFFMAGYETSSSTVSFALYELSLNPNIQDMARREIHKILAKHNNQLTYDAVMEMTYMDKILQETLRKYPPLPVIMRLCTKDYVIPDTTIELKKGTGVMMSILGLQTDPEYYPNPEVFDPDRFSEENKKTRPAFTWLPFGEGPRVCIGMRFGLLQSKIALIAILRNHKVKLNPKTKVPMQQEKRAFMTRADGGIWLDVDKL